MSFPTRTTVGRLRDPAPALQTGEAVKPRVVVLDDDTPARALTRVVLEHGLPDVDIDVAGDIDTLTRLLPPGAATAVVTGLELSFAPGPTVLQLVRTVSPATALVLLADRPEPGDLAEAVRFGLDGLSSRSPDGLLRLPRIVAELLERLDRERRGDLSAQLGLATFTLTSGGALRDLSRAAADVLGGDGVSTLTGRLLTDLVADPEARTQLRSLLAEGHLVEDEELALGSDAGERWIRLRLVPSRGADGRVLAWAGLVTDVTELRLREHRLADRAADLTRATSEVQEMAYMTSHDLQEPLQLVRRYLDLLDESAADGLDDDGRECLDQARHGAARMQAMIDGILEYARVETRGSTFSSVDFEAVVGEALANLKTVLEESDAVVDCHFLPVLDADRAQMVQLMQNFIGNAVKFCGEASPRIQIAATEQDNDWVFSVKDNGVGIPADEAESIFSMFRRLHTDEEVPGTGIGLAICKRIVERHGGRIWVVPAEDRGSIFYFTLPKPRPGDAADDGEE